MSSISGYIGAHYLWPPDHSSESAWFEFLELIIDFPFRLFALFIRGTGSFFRSGDLDL